VNSPLESKLISLTRAACEAKVLMTLPLKSRMCTRPLDMAVADDASHVNGTRCPL